MIMPTNPRRKKSVSDSQDMISYKSQKLTANYSPSTNFKGEAFRREQQDVLPKTYRKNYKEKQNHDVPLQESQYSLQFERSQQNSSQHTNAYEKYLNQSNKSRQGHIQRKSVNLNQNQNYGRSNYEYLPKQKNQDQGKNYSYQPKQQYERKSLKISDKPKYSYEDVLKSAAEERKVVETKKTSIPVETMKTPRKEERQFNNLVEKSEKVKHKIDKLSKMTPRSTLREGNEERFYSSSNQHEFSIPTRVPESARVQTKKLNLFEEEKMLGLQNITSITQRISERLQAIIQKHGK